MVRRFAFAFIAACLGSGAFAAARPHPQALDDLIVRYAHKHGIPESLVHRVVAQESGYEPRAFNRRFYGLMQITYQTARSMGYHGNPKGLLDPEVNLTYGVPYLANAYKVAGGNPRRAIRLYCGGYYFAAKRKRMLGDMRTAASPSLDAKAETASAQASTPTK